MKRAEKKTNRHQTTRIGDVFRGTGHIMDELGEKAGDKTDDLVNKGTEMAANMREEIGEYGDKMVGYVKEHPMQSLLIAGAVGLIVGKLIIRRF